MTARRVALRGVARGAVVAAVATAVAAGLAELFFASWYWFPTLVAASPLRDAARAHYLSHVRRVVQHEEAGARYDPELFYTLRPGQFRFVNPEFDTVLEVNDLGVRDDAASLDAPEIVVLGDSHAMGWGVGQDESFAQQLEADLGRTVLNASVSSYGTARELMLLGRVDRSALRVVVIQYCDNDHSENQAALAGAGVVDASPEAMLEQARARYREDTSYSFFKHSRLLLRPLLRRLAAAGERLDAATDGPGVAGSAALDPARVVASFGGSVDVVTIVGGVDGPGVELEGWAQDEARKEPARDVLLVVAGRVIQAEVTTAGFRPDVASALGAPALAASGFKAVAHRTAFGSASEQEIAAYAVGADGRLAPLLYRGGARVAVTLSEAVAARAEAATFVGILLHHEATLRDQRLVVFEVNGHARNDSHFVDALRATVAAGDLPPFVASMTILDLSADLDDGAYFAVDDHMTATGHRVVATALAAAIGSGCRVVGARPRHPSRRRREPELLRGVR